MSTFVSNGAAIRSWGSSDELSRKGFWLYRGARDFEQVATPSFVVSYLPMAVKATGLAGDDVVTVEMVFGEGAGEFFEPFRPFGHGGALYLDCCLNAIEVGMTGRYRLNLEHVKDRSAVNIFCHPTMVGSSYANLMTMEFPDKIRIKG